MRRLELLAPGGDLDSIKAAIVAGADAIYCGLDRFNARRRATNITFDDLSGVLALAHRHDCRVFLTLNIMMVEGDIPVLVGLLNKLVNTSLDGIIVQDLGLFHLLSTRFRSLKIHASTQLTTHNEGQIAFLAELGAARVNLSRELSVHEIRPLARALRERNIATEVFVHGSYCLSFSGICYMSSAHGGNSGNRGRCSQPCRDPYLTTPEGKDFPLNLKDNSAYFDLELLADAGVDAVKIEGRMKTFHYVHTVTNTYRRRLQSLYERKEPVDESGDLHKVFNRGFSNSFLSGEIARNMFSDHPRNRSATHLRGETLDPTEAYGEIANLKIAVGCAIEHVRIAKAPLTIRISGALDAPLTASVHAPGISFAVSSASRLALRGSASTAPRLDAERLRAKLKPIDATEYYIEHLDLEELPPDLFLPLRELTSMQRRILFVLNGGREPIAPMDVPALEARSYAQAEPTLSVLIASPRDLYLCDEAGAEFHFQLPSGLRNDGPAWTALFSKDPRLIPWFPSVLIGDDYAAAVKLLQKMHPRRLVTNNTGIAYEAWKAGIPWIAGPYLNTANSLSLASLKQNFACCGAFVSSELSKHQMRKLRPPENFELYYSIYHPSLLLTSRQCLFQQVTGCEKDATDKACIRHCERSSTITNLKGTTFRIHKSKGDYSSIYHHAHVLNTEIAADIPSLFSSFLIDLRDIETDTKTARDKSSLVRLFQDHLRGHVDSGRELMRVISPTTNTQYKLGI